MQLLLDTASCVTVQGLPATIFLAYGGSLVGIRNVKLLSFEAIYDPRTILRRNETSPVSEGPLASNVHFSRLQRRPFWIRLFLEEFVKNPQNG